ncbi:CDP-diacylglycerol--glycerol-3-phosphate 3-phosphatidyltransferase [Clostridium sp. MSJ-11]|uniref:CDP-diacylglycerol--glycerol-3-phosphate 3-phosphatidyltransferase n=1 Tax=Clostridium mobile TaxID=2841512 RepID=A0ABS6EMM2_9CLOT|nr:CDP-diacylglycerol--glycerol-3-phosphate 3-phosphatidyltransferase [Clostridium mobile]MBU5486372.1 CDP-diacylglycerol--glycerol-3-phosphate 3-phosphatidyltransferase [Clostridium mobile]
MNIPNILTLFRIFLIPVFILIFFSGIKNSFLFSTIIFFIAGITDVLDGYWARKYNIVTKWGVVLDPLADKLMLITVLSCLTIDNMIPHWMLLIVASKELAMIIAGAILYNKDFIIPSNIFGKVATCMFYLAIFILIFNEQYGRYFLDIAIGSAIIAFFNYLIFYLKQNKSKK